MPRFAVFAGPVCIGHSWLEHGDAPIGVAAGRFVPAPDYAAVQPAVLASAEGAQLALALQHLADASFGVNEWSGRAHLSERQLRRRVSELTGQAPVAWLRHQRLLRVRRLISEGSCRTLAEAGLASGFDNPSYLYRLYRAQFGAN